jgi:hypothetical protein
MSIDVRYRADTERCHQSMDSEAAPGLAPKYGNAPIDVGNYLLSDWQEYMHYMYLPVVMPERPGLRIPERLSFAADLIQDTIDRESGKFAYAYVTARRGYATPGNPLNRPGWHSDGFGTDDVNYVWTDRWPTDFAVQPFRDISTDHAESVRQFGLQLIPHLIRHYPDRELLRLDASVIHAAPTIPAPGGERSFFKVSFSNSRYNLAGNSHNYLFGYDWKMFSRTEVRNDPAYASKDAA